MNVVRLARVALLTFAIFALVACDTEADELRSDTPTPSAEGIGNDDPTAPTAADESPETETDENSEDEGDAGQNESPREVQAVEEGFVVRESSFDDSYMHSGYVLLENLSTSETADTFQVSMLFSNAEGLLLDTQTTYATLLPAQTSAVELTALLPEEAASIEVRMDDPSWDSMETTDLITVSDVEIVPDDFFSSIRGVLESPYSVDVESLEIVCLARDADGVVVAVDWSLHELLPAGTRASAECSLLEDDQLANAATAEMYWMFSFMTSVGE